MPVKLVLFARLCLIMTAAIEISHAIYSESISLMKQGWPFEFEEYQDKQFAKKYLKKLKTCPSNNADISQIKKQKEANKDMNKIFLNLVPT